MGRVSGKVVIITGAASGMGLAGAKLFCQEGAIVYAGVNRSPFPSEVLEEAKAWKGEIHPIQLTVSKEEDWISAVDLIVKQQGRIDVLINNAGGSCAKVDLLESTAEEWANDLLLNLTGPALGLKHCIPVMQKNGGGSIINTSSSSAISPDDGVPASYCTAKAGLLFLTKHCAKEYAKDNIRINSIIPGAFCTGGLKKMGVTQELLSARYAEKAPLPPHAGDPIEIAYAYLYLASDESKFVTGAEIAVDGGMII